MPAAVHNLRPLSIQGEADLVHPGQHQQMDIEDVEAYCDSVSGEVLDCREQRHRYPSTRQVRASGIQFIGRTRDGLLVSELSCTHCRLVGRLMFWHARWVGKGQDRHVEIEHVGSRPDYSKRGPNGERYLAPAGHGRISPRQIRQIQMTRAVQDLFRSPVDIKKLPLFGK